MANFKNLTNGTKKALTFVSNRPQAPMAFKRNSKTPNTKEMQAANHSDAPAKTAGGAFKGFMKQ